MVNAIIIMLVITLVVAGLAWALCAASAIRRELEDEEQERILAEMNRRRNEDNDER